ncbi:serine phosphatase RsbU (regulator of sigma subunit) [Pseudonocardia sediminis]|uniref:Serine phosphatase RsbU (Regulator of sigma subunit) n=1 Tax=Pseudonocardia sediminis TaxID=1397368 RepID=A0A4Q7V051_PSEST|nr:GAF domain-containing SpoIIE family protein phosphatase [Pseudonocardia sediminis]RZT87812.1 serine phosphatase RsbU (regulator of sigma subunit) [Pseudonocardia sediminis]
MRESGVRSADRVAAVQGTRLMDTGPEEAFNRLTRLASVVLGTPMVAFTVVDDVRSFLKGTPDPAVLVGADGTFETPIKEAACQVVVDTGEEVCVGDVGTDPRLRDLPQIRAFGAASWIGVPVRDEQGHVLGNLCAMDSVVRDWTHQHREALHSLALAAAAEITLRRALRDTQVHSLVAALQADRSADLARTLQQSLVPVSPPQQPGVEIGARFVPGGTGVEVMGDFYDVVPAGDGFGIVVGDVCGKGAPAARTTAMARSAVRTAAHSDADPAHVLGTVNEVLHVWFAGRTSFVTAVYATFLRPADPGTGPWRVTVASAGHPPAFTVGGRGGVGQLGGGGRVLGVGAESMITTETLDLYPGDSLVLYTDGVCEARPPGSHSQFEETGAADALARTRPGASAAAITDALVDAAVAHSGGTVGDDTGVVVVRIAP